MKNKLLRVLQKEDGVSLVEVVASIVLISIILISFFGFFTNTFKFNAMNDDNFQASNLAKDWKNTVRDYNWQEIVDPANGFIKVASYYVYESNVDEFNLKIIVNEEPEQPVLDYFAPLRKVHIQIWKSGQLVSETYTYHESD